MLGAGATRVERTGPPLDAELAGVLAAIEGEGSGGAVVGATTPGADAIAVALDLPAARASAALARLELLGYLAPTAVGTFTRTLLVAPKPAGRYGSPAPVPHLGSTDGG